jgi:hypothetical protein
LFDRILDWLGDTSLAGAVRENEMLFPWTESIHVLALTIVVGSIAIVDLRLLGVASRGRPVTKLMQDVLPITWVAFLGALISGLMMFISQATVYMDNFYFKAKMVLMMAAGVNVLVFHTVTARSAVQWDAEGTIPMGAKAAGAASLTLWTLIVVFGRWIGFS